MTRMVIALAAASGLVAAGAGCGTRPAGASSAKPAVVDSAVPRLVALDRFRAGTVATDSLIGGATTREQLIRAFVAALEQRDTVALRNLVLDKNEFAWVYYPTAAQGLPPYDLSPNLLWFMTSERSSVGLARALRSYGGQSIHYALTNCDPKPAVEGENRIWGPCAVVHRNAEGGTGSERLFGAIIERRGRFKFVSYANKLD